MLIVNEHNDCPSQLGTLKAKINHTNKCAADIVEFAPSMAKGLFSWHYHSQPYLPSKKTSFGFIECAYLKLLPAHLLLMS